MTFTLCDLLLSEYYLEVIFIHVSIWWLFFSSQVRSDSLQPHGLQHSGLSVFFSIFCSFLRFMFIELVMLYDHLICCHSLFLLPSTFPSIRVFYKESALHIRWPKDWSFSFSIMPSNEYSGLNLGWTDWISLLSKHLSRVLSSTTIRKHQFFAAHSYLWSSSHICTWLLEKLYGILSTKWCLCFLICFLGLS